MNNMFWLETIIASVICFIAVEFRISSWLKEHGYSRDDFKDNGIEQKLLLLGFICIPVVNLVFMTVLLVGSFSDEIMEEAVKRVRK